LELKLKINGWDDNAAAAYTAADDNNGTNLLFYENYDYINIILYTGMYYNTIKV
jgi:hypothetical protein